MLDAARELFLESGYAATTLAAVAERANVALPTLYAAFGSKRNLLAELLEEREGGSDVSMQLVTAEQLVELKAVEDAREKLGLLATFVAAHLERSYDLRVALRVAAGAEPEAAVLEQKRQDDDHAALRAVGTHLHSSGALRSGVSAASAADTLWALADVQLFTMLVRTRGWRLSKYRTWLADTMTASLLS